MVDGAGATRHCGDGIDQLLARGWSKASAWLFVSTASCRLNFAKVGFESPEANQVRDRRLGNRRQPCDSSEQVRRV